MGVFNRMSDIINSNISAVLDHAEDPEKMINQITREMETTLFDARIQSAREIAEQRQIHARIHRLEVESGQWEQRAELAIGKGREDLAKSALREKSRIDETVRLLESDAQAIDEAMDKLKHDILALEEKLHSVRARRKALVIRGQTAKSRIKVKRQLHHTGREDALIRFERYERKIEDMEAVMESYIPCKRPLAEEIRELEQEHKLDVELGALKERLQARQATGQ